LKSFTFRVIGLALVFGLVLAGCEWTVGADSYTFKFMIRNESTAAIDKVVFYNGTNRKAFELRRLDKLNLTKGELSSEYKIFGFTKEYGTDERYYAVLITYEDGNEIFAYGNSGPESKILVTLKEELEKDSWPWSKEITITFSPGDW
jgi:hypothetical protein